MLIQINTDNNIDSGENLINYFTQEIEESLKRFDEYITRVEVHLGDENAKKQGNEDKRCMLEVRMKNLQPVAVTHYAATLHLAVKGASDKITSVLDSKLGQLRNH